MSERADCFFLLLYPCLSPSPPFPSLPLPLPLPLTLTLFLFLFLFLFSNLPLRSPLAPNSLYTMECTPSANFENSFRSTASAMALYPAGLRCR